MKSLNILLIASVMTLSPLARALPPITESECLQDYFTLFSNDKMDVTLAFGYDDNGDTTDDRLNLNRFVYRLTAKCTSLENKGCGFTLLTPMGVRPAELTKKMIGPDGKEKTVNIHLNGPSISDNDTKNRANPEQVKKSAEVKKFFLDGLKKSQIIFYMGHSRDGGGPSFSPPKLHSNGHVDYDWYHHHKVDKRDMEMALRESPGRTRIIALLSCSSTRWFSAGVSGNAPTSGFIGTTADYYANRFEHAFTIINNIFSYSCLKGMSIDDAQKSAKIKTERSWKVPAKDKAMGSAKSHQQAVANLSNLLADSDKSIRQAAYEELTAYDKKYLTPEVQSRMNDYRLGKGLKKLL